MGVHIDPHWVDNDLKALYKKEWWMGKLFQNWDCCRRGEGCKVNVELMREEIKEIVRVDDLLWSQESLLLDVGLVMSTVMVQNQLMRHCWNWGEG